ncbi:MAG TPA: chaperonin [Myxococcales bacterium]|nr:chaperonin [Deltaproteobacteria bacterium]MBU48366.1 chaperonin [Deltaproteobacteria bacterium]HAA54031.1 chaperonin [Myxococcales bacterium]
MSTKELIVIGDRVLLKIDDEEKRTEVGLYLPQTLQEKEEVVGGTIVKTGKGTPMVDPLSMTESPWKNDQVSLRYIPMEANVGDYALFLQKAAIEIEYNNEKYYILPQSAILVLIREQKEGEEIN